MGLFIHKAFSEVQTIDGLCAFLRHAEPSLTTCGNRCIQSQGYEGNLPIDEVVARVFKLARQNINYNETDRILGHEITRKVDDFYSQTDEMLTTCNLFKFCIGFLIDLWIENIKNGGYSDRWEWRYAWGNQIFNYYTEDQYVRVFEHPPITERYSRLTSGYPDQWLLI